MKCRLFLVQNDVTGLTKSDRTSNSRLTYQKFNTRVRAAWNAGFFSFKMFGGDSTTKELIPAFLIDISNFPRVRAA
ncbi:hypothetical protein SAMN06265375_1011058 [Muriicola jejuensis]|nr:hypothetical protein SAMN06265375_1011058 [Muriicola jejuensis]